MIQMTRLDGPFECEALYSPANAVETTIYYHIDSGFGGTPNESVRLWWIDAADFARSYP
jgi:hypothetical protein